MKRNYFILLCVFFIGFITSAQNANLSWAHNFGAAGGDQGTGITTDAAGNIYITGAFQSTVDFDSSSAVVSLTAQIEDTYICKYDASGALIWARSLPSVSASSLSSNNTGTAIKVDGSGKVYVTGTFLGAIDLDPGAATYTALSAGFNDVYILSLDASGNFIWAKTFGGSDEDVSVAIDVDGTGNVYTTGNFRNTVVDFDPGIGTYTLQPAGGDDIFIHKLDASGNFVWGKKIGSVNYEYVRSLFIDAAGNVFTTGGFISAIDFDPGAGVYNLTPTSLGDAFISKLDASGSFIAAVSLAGVGSGAAIGGNCIKTDGAGNVYITGSYIGTCDFDPGNGTFNITSGGNQDIFVTKLNATLGFVWAKSMGGTGGDVAISMDVDVNGNTYLTGAFAGTADFDPGAGVYNLVAASFSSLFVSKLNSVGSFEWARGFNSSSYNNYVASLTVDPNQNVYTTGYFRYTVDFDPGPGAYNLSSAGSTVNALSDVFVLKLCQTPVQPQSISSNTLLCSGQPATYSIFPVAGAASYSWSFPGSWTGTSSSTIIAITANSLNGTIAVTANNSCGASSPNIVNATVNASPTITALSGSICIGDSFTISISGANTYTFLNGSAIVSPTITNSYSIVGTGTNGCVSNTPGIAVVTVYTLPVISVNNGTICSNRSFTIIPTGAATYTFSNGSPIVSPTATSSYSVYGTNAQGCVSSVPAISTVSLNTSPIPTISVNNGSICSGASFTIIPSGAITYSISGGSAIVSPPSTSGYSVSGTGAGGCISTTPAIASVSVYSLPAVSVSTSNTMICNGETVTLSSSGGDSYLWNNGTSSPQLIVQPSVTTSYSVTGSSIHGCQNTAIITQSVADCVGIYSINHQPIAVKIYPNPMRDKLYLEGSNNSALHWRINNQLGQVILSGVYQEDIDVHTLPAGIYFLQLENETQTNAFKIIKE